MFDSMCVATRIGDKIPEFVQHSGMWIKEIEVSGLDGLCVEVVDRLGPDKIAHGPLIQKACDKLGIQVKTPRGHHEKREENKENKGRSLMFMPKEFADILFIDTETYSETPISNGTYKYTANCEVMLVLWAVNGGAVECWDVTTGALMPSALSARLNDDKTLVVMHNSMFDRNALARIGVVLPTWRIIDTMVLAYAHSLPGKLATLCEIFKLGADGKDTDGSRLIQLFCKPLGKNRKLRRATRETHPTEWAKFIDYGNSDITSMRRLYELIPKWNLTVDEVALWQLDQKINDRGMLVDQDLALAALRAVDRAQTDIKAQVRELTDETVQSATQRDALLEFIAAEHGVVLADLRKGNIARILEDPDFSDGLKELLRLRVDACSTSPTKYKALLKAASADGRLRGTKQFCGAFRTGRWAGRTFQPDNLPRPPEWASVEDVYNMAEMLKLDAAHLVYDNPILAAASAIRGSLIAPDGKALFVSDLANIEGRVQAWCADEKWKIQAFIDYDTMDADGNRKGPDLYKLAYARSFQILVEAVTKYMRQIGKVQELALAYAGGVGAFISFALIYRIDLGELARKALPSIPPDVLEEATAFTEWLRKQKKPLGMPLETFIVCDSLKRLWRRAHPMITSYWSELEAAVEEAVSYPKRDVACRKVTIRRDGAWLRIVLPSGRSMCYPGIRLDDDGGRKPVISYMGADKISRKWVRVKSFGGKFFENICQAVARDVLAYNMPLIEHAGYDIVLTVHDEVVAEAPDSAEYSVKEVETLMCFTQPWAEGLPLAADGYKAYRYRK